MRNMETLILVDKSDKETGYEEKGKCHLNPAKLHRAFSIFIFDSKGRMLVHKRSVQKNTWPGFWTNACCSHPRKGESIENAAKRRLKEELGFSCALKEVFSFVYKAEFDENYGENEFDHIFIGKYDGAVKPDKNEVDEWKFVDVARLENDIKKHPEKYTPWFKKALGRVLKKHQ